MLLCCFKNKSKTTRFKREEVMKALFKLAAAAALLAASLMPAQAQELIVGVSWSNFQEERWKTDEAA